MEFWTYILKCSDGSYYTGHTDDLGRRIAQHGAGYFSGCYTYKRRPLKLVWTQDFPSRYEALSAERKIKNWSRGKKEALIARDWDRLSFLAIPPKERATRTRELSPTLPEGSGSALTDPSTSLGTNGIGS